MNTRIAASLVVVLALTLGCEIETVTRETPPPAPPVDLETRTFALKHLNPSVAETLVRPYVYEDRPGAPGVITYSMGPPALSARETADNLDKIARMLERFDVAAKAPSSSYGLRFQVVAANGGESDVRLAPFEAALRKVFRFDGYSLVGEGYVTVSTGDFDLTIIPGGAVGAAGDPDDAGITLLGRHPGSYNIEGTIDEGELALEIVGPSIRLRDGRWAKSGTIQTTLGFRPGQTLVLGSMPAADQTVFIVVHVAESVDGEPA